MNLKQILKQKLLPALLNIERRNAEFLRGLIQPRHIPAHPKRPPRRAVEVLITLLGIIGWGIFLRYYDRVSPTASLDLRHDRGAVRELAQEYLIGRAFDLTGYRRVVTFGSDWMTQIYLEREVGVPRMNQLVRDKIVPLWTWNARWFVPEQREEFRVSLLPTGEVVGFSRAIAEDAAGATIGEDAARRIAEDYLTADRGIDLSEWELYDAAAETKPNRVDHRLTWKKRGVEIGAGDLRISVTIQGDAVGGFDTWFRVPEAFSREYTEQRSRAQILSIGAMMTSMLFYAGIFLIWRQGFTAGIKIAGAAVAIGFIAGAVALLDSLNYLPLLDAGYNTAVNYGSYVLNRLLGYAASAMFNAVFVVFLLVPALWLTRAVWPRTHKIKPDVRDPWGHLARSAWRGMMLGGLMAAYMVIFYSIARGLGAWSPVRTPSLNLLATPFPFIAAIMIGLLPALLEELEYRALAIGLMTRLFEGRVWLALLISSLTWGFAHSGYVTDPIWLRGVELTISALLLTGLFFLLFDITTTIVAHYTYNATLTALVLVRSGQPLLVVTGMIAALLGLTPVIIWVILKVRAKIAPETPALTISVESQADWDAVQALGGPHIAGDRPPTQLVCLKDARGNLEGYAVGTITDVAGTQIGQVLHIFVTEQYRERYYGTALYRVLAEWFREQGIARVEAQVSLKDSGATTFWVVQGFNPAARVLRKRYSLKK